MFRWDRSENVDDEVRKKKKKKRKKTREGVCVCTIKVRGVCSEIK